MPIERKNTIVPFLLRILKASLINQIGLKRVQ